MSSGLILLKRPISPLILLLEVWNVKTTCRKSWPGNHFQMLNLMFDPCFKVKCCRHTKTSSLLLVLWLQNVKTDHEKSWPANVLPEKNFGLILKNKMAAIANYFEIIMIL